jgi:hypothetical protein
MSRVQQREAVKKLLSQRHFLAWRQYENLGGASAETATESANASRESSLPWRVQAQETLRILSDDTGISDDIDISVTGARVPTEEEEAEAMIVKRLEAENIRSESRLEAENSRGRSRDCKALGSRSRSRSQPAQNAEGADQQGQADLDEVAPIRTIAEIRGQRQSRARTRSARLVLESYRDSATPVPPFTKAANEKPVIVYSSISADDPHRACVDRVAARCAKVFYPKSKHPNWRMSECTPADATGIPADFPRMDPGDIIVTVAVCNTQGHKEQEFDMLASQSLEQLRDAFWFVQDWMFDGPRRIKSACFFIDGTFYVDRRHPSALDYSKDMLDWLKETQPEILRSDKSKSMNTRICDMERIPFGERCIYLHQGDIEHNVFFTGARLVSPGDCPYLEAYPVLIFMRKHIKRRCYACVNRFAIWMVLDSAMTPHNPCFMCYVCFKHFFQDASGEMIPPVDYKVFPYLHDE